MILPRKRVIWTFISLAVLIQMGYYFEFLEFQAPPVELFDFRGSPFFHPLLSLSFSQNYSFNYSSNYSSSFYPSSSPVFTPLHTICTKTKWHPNVYINCSFITLPAFDAINQLQVCIRWAVDAGVGLVRPTFIINESTSERTDIEFLLDESFLWQALAENCPLLKVVETSELGSDVVELEGDPFFPGKLYRKGSYSRYLQIRLNHEQLPNGTKIVMREDGSFCGWERRRDPLPLQLAFKHLFRFSRPLATISARILPNLPHSFFGAHLYVAEEEDDVDEERVEKLLDTVLSHNASANPVVYVACANALALGQFTQRAQERGVIATHAWAAAKPVDAGWMKKTLTVEQVKVVDHMVLLHALYVYGHAGSIDAFMLGMDRHVIQYGNLEYHGVDRQQYLFGYGVNLWDGNSW